MKFFVVVLQIVTVFILALSSTSNALNIGSTVTINGDAVIISETEVEYEQTRSYSLLWESPINPFPIVLVEGELITSIDFGGPIADIVYTHTFTRNFNGGIFKDLPAEEIHSLLVDNGLIDSGEGYIIDHDDVFQLVFSEFDGISQLKNFSIIESYGDYFSDWYVNIITSDTVNMKLNSEFDVWGDVVGDDTFPATRTLSFNLISETSVAAVPEPASMILFGSGLIGLVGFRKKFKK